MNEVEPVPKNKSKFKLLKKIAIVLLAIFVIWLMGGLYVVYRNDRGMKWCNEHATENTYFECVYQKTGERFKDI